MLEEQKTEGFFYYSIVVVDNDKAESARQTVESYLGQSNRVIRYYVEPQQNIALARNRAIENANGDFVAFIDDDELPNSEWLLNLYKAIMRFKVDGILGPVLPRFEREPPRWVLKGNFFERPVHSTGDVLDWKNTRTGNVLIKKYLFKDNRDWFNLSFGSGGEDRDFFKRKIKQGYIFVWCNRAPVFEILSPQRWQKKVLIKRALLRGKMALNSADSRLKSILISGFAVAIYTVSLPFLLFFSPIFGYDVFMKYLIKNCDHFGKIFALLKIDLVRTKYIGG